MFFGTWTSGSAISYEHQMFRDKAAAIRRAEAEKIAVGELHRMQLHFKDSTHAWNPGIAGRLIFAALREPNRQVSHDVRRNAEGISMGYTAFWRNSVNAQTGFHNFPGVRAGNNQDQSLSDTFRPGLVHLPHCSICPMLRAQLYRAGSARFLNTKICDW